MTQCTTYIHSFRHLYIVCMHILCKYCFVRIVVDLFAGLFNCLKNFSLELCVCVFMRACVRVCLSPSLSPIFSKYSSFLLCLWSLFAEDYLVYYKHYHNIAVSCTKTGIKTSPLQIKRFIIALEMCKILNRWMIIYNVHENLHARTCMFTQGFGEKKHAYIFTYAHCKKYNVLYC